MRFNPGDQVVIVGGDPLLEGVIGTVGSFDETLERYVVDVVGEGKEGSPVALHFACAEGDLVPLAEGARVELVDIAAFEDDGEPPAFGMTPEEAGEYFREFMARSAERIEKEGAAKYDRGGYQTFEAAPPAAVLKRALREVGDAAVYLAFLDAKLRRYLSALEEV